MHKLWLSSGLALFVGLLTLITGLLSDIRVSTILYRFIISFIVFGLLGYGLAVLAEKFAASALTSLKSKGQKIDIISEQQPVSETKAEDDTFVPFTPDNLERIPIPKD